MPLHLKRYQQEGEDHFLTLSCHDRKPYLNSEEARNTFLHSLERTRQRYTLEVLGYVVTPEHVHLPLANLKPNASRKLSSFSSGFY